jgi:hypothetical protein
MRKKTPGRKASGQPTRPNERRGLQLTRETLRTLSSDELSNVTAGLICPTGMSNGTKRDTVNTIDE